MFTTPIILMLIAAARNVSAIGCATHTYGTCEDNIVHWYDPDDGMICDLLDCGGGRAPPKTTDPCCGGYEGTEACVSTTSYLSCFSAKQASISAPAAITTPSIVVTTTESSVNAPTTSSVNAPTTSPGSSPTTSTISQTSLTSSNAGTITSTPTTSRATVASGNSSSSSNAQTTSMPNAAYSQHASLMALAGAAIGAVLL